MEKRGRGRPRKDGALTNAQRQAAFRARRAAQGKTVTVTKNIPAAADGYDELVLENERLREELASARDDVESLRRDLAPLREMMREPVGCKWSYRQVTAVAEKCILYFMAKFEQAKKEDSLFMQHVYREQAAGVRFAWYDLTVGWQIDGDNERLNALVWSVTSNDKSGV
ncbi:hypothetical protein [Paraburkholderia sp. Ac-20336]|uniref:hypothetical protein n=1 Tax=Paraburkholderia sp. Ac-20336 TaxID=2703886 RepID=UPI001F11E1EC|nr:hypothetical protein [Paraburkholderia sp. Ac-20336]